MIIKLITDFVRTELVESASFPECNRLMSLFLFTSLYNIMSSLTPLLCLENGTTRSEMVAKIRLECLKSSVF